MQQWIEQVNLFNAAAATASTVAYPVADRQHVFLTFWSTWTANYTMKFQISNQITPPNFAAAASPTNQWTYVQIKELTTNAAIDWATWISAAWADAVRIFEVNTNGQRWLWATITAYAAGALTLWLSAKNNQ